MQLIPKANAPSMQLCVNHPAARRLKPRSSSCRHRPQLVEHRTFTATAGTSFTIPVHVPHAIWNESGARVRFLNIIVAARYLDYFREMAAAATAGLPRPEVIAKVMGHYGLQPVSH